MAAGRASRRRGSAGKPSALFYEGTGSA